MDEQPRVEREPDPRFDRVHNIYVCGLDYDSSCDECRKGFVEESKMRLLNQRNQQRKS